MSDDPDLDGEADDPLIGIVLASRYRLDKRLGSGAMGAVYRASHIKMGRRFAVKILRTARDGEEKLARRFEREAELGGKVRHPNVVSVVDVGETPEGMRFMVMDLAVGVDLATLLQDEAPFASSRVIHLLRGICEGLAHAHERDVIHRDLKPENIIVEIDDHGREVPRIVDFGIAIAREEADEPASPDRLTTSGLVLGTPHYMAPEQATGRSMDHRIDLFALGVVAYEMVSGVLPFDGSGSEVARANLLEPTPPMAERAPGVEVDALLEAVVDRLMAKEPDARPATADAVRELLDLIEHDRAAAAALLGLPIEAAEPPRHRGGPKRLETVPDPALAAKRAAKLPPSWLTPSDTKVLSPPPPPVPVAAPVVVSLVAPAAGVAPRRTREDSDAIAPARSGRGSRIVIAVLVLAIVGGGGAWIATRPSEPPVVAVAPHDAAVPTIAIAPDAAAVALTPAAPDAAVVAEVPVDAAIAVIAPPPPLLDAAVARPRAPVDAAVVIAPPPPPVHVDAAVAVVKPPAPDAAVASSVAPTAADVAHEYTGVGEALKALQAKIGSNNSEQLWMRFRLIRLQDALATEASRRAALATLAELRRDIATAAAAN